MPKTHVVQSLGLRLVRYECATEMDACALERATNEVLRKLQDGLTRVLGLSAVDALATRALRLAQREHAELADVTFESGQNAVALLADAIADMSTGEALLLSAAIPQQLVNLLVSLLGADVALIPITRIWPASVFEQETQEPGPRP